MLITQTIPEIKWLNTECLSLPDVYGMDNALKVLEAPHPSPHPPPPQEQKQKRRGLH